MFPSSFISVIWYWYKIINHAIKCQHRDTISIFSMFFFFLRFGYLTLYIGLPTIKGILWDRRWSSPSIRIFSHTCWFLYGNAFLIMTLSKPPSFRVIRALIASQSMFEQFISYFLIVVFYLILHKFCSVLTCNILGIGLL